ncbi:hypothetical protein K458DRAFT_412887 [Lentithecium fluviatile CBS 122367]|uniref:Uncharacterized protein n=1 Tax=Lentithecium fluviatile CBS 122367 TaxID=1168545 RepID=A0A6G1JHU9_9PLEO|nr:hypothetical protein K458DRAFT_412887 [Lentithecium fluviatile CBS 122367]
MHPFAVAPRPSRPIPTQPKHRPAPQQKVIHRPAPPLLILPSIGSLSPGPHFY